jgi:predicted enzyme related to lactoylglutathione lyase
VTTHSPMPAISGGVNIAMKIPKADYEATLAFYRDILGLDLQEVADTGAPTVSRAFTVSFGPNTLWLDCVDSFSRTDIWLELRADDVEAATERLTRAGFTPVDEIEQHDDVGVRSHWIRDPAGTIHHLVQG